MEEPPTTVGQIHDADLGQFLIADDSCAEVVKRWDGHVAKYMGDGVLAYFGWPRAHEDDAERAVRAGLELVETVAGLRPGAGANAAARVGIATGLVMVGELIGEGPAQEQTVVGETPNLAARLQALADPGAVVISSRTRRLVAGGFELDDLGHHRLKGFAEPMAAWRVARTSRAEGRFEAHQTAGLTPLVGRAEEISLLLRRWQQARDGEGQVVLLSGEPGIGKSRIVRELRERLSDQAHVGLSYHCSPHHQTSPLHPIIEQLERAAGFERDDTAAGKLAMLEALLARGTDELQQAVPLVAALLGIATDDRYPPRDLTPRRQKQRTLEVLVDQLEGLTTAQPMLLVCEDVHWIDPTTQELLQLVIERVQRLPILLMITFRPEFSPPWTSLPHVSALALVRLGRRDVAALVERMVRDKLLPAEVSAQIVAKTDGVPLFVEELTKAVLESGLLSDAGDHYELSGPLPPLAMPSTLHGSLLARLDRLGQMKEIAQIGAAIGREFSHTLVAAVADKPESELGPGLDELIRSELVFRRGTPPEAIYSFKHALVQDAAYGTLLKSRRQHLHARIVRVLEARFPETAAAQPDLLAQHCAEAGLPAKAAAYWYEAGQRALARSATVEAVARLNRGREAVGELPKGAERDRLELDLQVALGGAQLAARGWAVPETGEAYGRARELCERLGGTRQLFPVLWGLTVFHINTGELAAGREIAEEMLGLAERQHDDAAQVASHRALSAVLYHLGEWELARRHLELVVLLYGALPTRPPPSLYTVDHLAMALSFLAPTLFALGYPDQSRARRNEALTYTRDLNHPHSLALVLAHLCEFHSLAHEWEAVRDMAEALVAVSTEQGFSEYAATGHVFGGCALAELGQTREGFVLYQRASVARRVGYPLHCGILAEAHRKAGDCQEALRLLVDALGRVERTGERWFEAELHRLKGDVLLAISSERSSEVEACYHRALAVARNQGAHLWELRAATSLARLWRDGGKPEQALELLAPVYDWFTEGFDTTDLKDARALLDAPM